MEIDSMEAVTNSGSEANFESGIVRRYQANAPVSGQSILGLSLDLRGSDDVYENGRIEITNVGTFNVVRNIDRWFAGDDAIISATPGTNVIGKGFRIYDDDDRFLSTIGLPPALPKDPESTNIVAGIRPVFIPAYIDVTNANAEGFNPTKRIAFKRNEKAVGFAFSSVFDDAKDITDRSSFWAHTVTFGYQAEVGEDRDPNTEEPLTGGTPYNLLTGSKQGYSAVFLESIRDERWDQIASANINNPATYPFLTNNYYLEILGVVAHEVGHGPGNQSEDDDHKEEGIMQIGGATIQAAKFSPLTIKRFRQSTKWD